ncbi:MAG: DUF4089 domain-containing protein [Beijerinckiaceae bacterium]|nr:DUF4089 domain-containing protein [Beijerinckiaceae bacterium]
MSAASNDNKPDLGAYMEAAAALMNLPIPEASKPIVREQLEVAARMAAMLAEFDLDMREEPAPVFRPEART